MVNTCALVECHTGYKCKKKSDVENPVETEKYALFGFPDAENNKELRNIWIRFVRREDFNPKHSGICAKHFEEKFLKRGKRVTLRWELNPVPTIYSLNNNIPQSLLPTPVNIRKPPSALISARKQIYRNEDVEFREQDMITGFTDLEDLCPANFTVMKTEDKIIFYNIAISGTFCIPEVVATICVDKEMHVKLFKFSQPLPLPEWFRSGTDCKLKRKSVLENFPAYIENFDSDQSNKILEELLEIKNYKKTGRPKYSADILRFALVIRYTSRQAYKLLLEQLPLPSMSLLKNLKAGGIEPLKATKLLLDNNKIGKDVVLLADEMYLQKGMQYHGGKLIGSDEDGQLYKGIMVFMIVSLKQSIPFVIKAVPEVSVEGVWLRNHIDESITSLQGIGFQVRAVITDNYSSNVSAFTQLIEEYGFSPEVNAIIHPSSCGNYILYLFFDAVHILKNIRNNLLNYRRFIFPSFTFDGFFDKIYLPAGEISWKLLHDIIDKDAMLQANLKKAYKLTYRALHPGNNKQDMNLALSIFHSTTSAAIESYFPDRKDASSFLALISTWWTIMNSKQQFNSNNRLGNAVIPGDNKPHFLRQLASWLEEWQGIKIPNSEKIALSKQTSCAFITTLKCTASLIEELLEEGYGFILLSRLFTDPLERHFSKYRQMSGGRFLVSLREVEESERILAMKSLLKESIDVWENNVQKDKPDVCKEVVLEYLAPYKSDIERCMLEEESVEVSDVVAGYIAKKVIKKTGCNSCNTLLALSDYVKDDTYLSKLSRGGLIVPSPSLSSYVAKCFAIMDIVDMPIRQSKFDERIAAEYILDCNDNPKDFICCHHVKEIKYIHRIIVNSYNNNAQKISLDSVRKDTVTDFKQRQRKKIKLS